MTGKMWFCSYAVLKSRLTVPFSIKASERMIVVRDTLVLLIRDTSKNEQHYAGSDWPVGEWGGTEYLVVFRGAAVGFCDIGFWSSAPSGCWASQTCDRSN